MRMGFIFPVNSLELLHKLDLLKKLKMIKIGAERHTYILKLIEYLGKIYINNYFILVI